MGKERGWDRISSSTTKYKSIDTINVMETIIEETKEDMDAEHEQIFSDVQFGSFKDWMMAKIYEYINADSLVEMREVCGNNATKLKDPSLWQNISFNVIKEKNGHRVRKYAELVSKIGEYGYITDNETEAAMNYCMDKLIYINNNKKRYIDNLSIFMVTACGNSDLTSIMMNYWNANPLQYGALAIKVFLLMD